MGLWRPILPHFQAIHHGKLFTAANKKRQARIAWEEVQKFILIDKDLGELFRVQDWKSMITALNTNCTIEALSKESGLDDGFRSVFSSIDEIHQARDGSVYNAVPGRHPLPPETLVSAITTRRKTAERFLPRAGRLLP